MLSSLVKKIFGSRNERVLSRLQSKVRAINALEATLVNLSDEELRGKTQEFRDRLQKGETLDSLLPEAFAVVREASKRTLGLRHFDVQLIGGMVLHEGKIAEMRTGEGKTLVGTLPAYLNSLTGKGVHIITVNDYLAQRDCEWMRPVYEFLGLTVGVIINDLTPDVRQQAYACDITYGTNNEFGFDYLRDNMTFRLEDRVQRELNFAVVDEVDSILIDEARTPLIISGPAEGSSELYISVNKLIPSLIRQQEENGEGDYFVDEKQRQVFLTEQGHEHTEELMIAAGLIAEGDSLYSPSNIGLMHHLNASLRAHALFQKDVDYIVKNGEVVIVDEHTGRTMQGRRWSEGLHQAVEAKEGVNVQTENQTLASITFQNYFRLYNKLAGMTGTADTEAYEFQQIYRLEVVVMPTNKPMVRKDEADIVYLTQDMKYRAIINDVLACVQRQQPVLVGTASIESSEYLSNLLEKQKIPHQVLNAKFHKQEASIIAEAGRPGAVTIATNMAGRGTDIVLGGNWEAQLGEQAAELTDAEREKMHAEWQQRHDAVINAGGLRIIGSERHESRRIDNQLRGRAGRQGDPGSSCFYLSLEDNLMRIFASERMSRLMKGLGMDEDSPIVSGMVSKAIENAQRKVEGRNFDIRKQLLQYDDVANDQRKVIYEQRQELLREDDVSETVNAIREAVIESTIQQFIPFESMEEQWDVTGLQHVLASDFAVNLELVKWVEQDSTVTEEHIREKVVNAVRESLVEKEEKVTPTVMRQVEKSLMLQTLDHHWREHLASMDHLRQGIHLRGYAQKDPKQEYKREAFNLFSQMLERIKRDVISVLCTVEVRAQEDVDALEQQRREDAERAMQISFNAGQVAEGNDELGQLHVVRSDDAKVGRNDPCPCNSGKKYKQCHGVL